MQEGVPDSHSKLTVIWSYTTNTNRGGLGFHICTVKFWEHKGHTVGCIKYYLSLGSLRLFQSLTMPNHKNKNAELMVLTVIWKISRTVFYTGYPTEIWYFQDCAVRKCSESVDQICEGYKVWHCSNCSQLSTHVIDIIADYKQIHWLCQTCYNKINPCKNIFAVKKRHTMKLQGIE